MHYLNIAVLTIVCVLLIQVKIIRALDCQQIPRQYLCINDASTDLCEVREYCAQLLAADPAVVEYSLSDLKTQLSASKRALMRQWVSHALPFMSNTGQPTQELLHKIYELSRKIARNEEASDESTISPSTSAPDDVTESPTTTALHRKWTSHSYMHNVQMSK